MLTPVTKPSVRVTEIGEYIHYQSCDRRFKLEHNNRKLARELPFAKRLFNSLDPVLQEAGRLREKEWETSLKNNELQVNYHFYDSAVSTAYIYNFF